MCRAESLTQRVKDAEEDEKAALERARREGRVRGSPRGGYGRERERERERERGRGEGEGAWDEMEGALSNAEQVQSDRP